MEILLILLILLIVFPAIFVWLLIPLILLIIFFLPIPLLFYSLATVVTVPQTLVKIAFNKDLRRHHALEHATVNVLEEHYGKGKLAGFAVDDGFKLLGAAGIPPELIYKAAEEGLGRLQAGEKHLALHKRCGTSLVMFNFLFAIGFLFLLFTANIFYLTYVLIGLLLINVLARPLGQLVQKYITTSPDVTGLYIYDVVVSPARSHPLLGMLFSEYKVNIGKYHTMV